MYAVTSMPEVRRTRQTLRNAEFGFFGVVVYTRVHTPRRCGEPFRARVLFVLALFLRPLRTSCWMVGMPGVLRLVSGRRGAGAGRRMARHRFVDRAVAPALRAAAIRARRGPGGG